MAEKIALHPVPDLGWRSGLGNLLGKEFSLWFGTLRWLKQAVLWTLILNGMLALISLTVTKMADGQPLLVVQVQLFLGLSGMATAIGAVIATQDAIIGERQSGTAQWILSKPASRPAFVLSKLIANSVGFLLLAVLIQAPIAYAQFYLWAGETPALVGFAQALGLLGLNVLFYVALTLMLGTLFQVRSAVAGIALGFFGAGMALPNLVPKSMLYFPWKLPDFGTAIALGMPVPPEMHWPLPVIATVLWTLLFVAVALVRFEREEL